MTSTAEPVGATRVKRERLAWLRPPKGTEDGTMSLGDHLREVRYRVTVATIFIVIGTIASAFFYQQLVEFIMSPYEAAKAAVQAANPDADLMVTNNGVLQPFTLAVMASALAGLLVSSPFWLYQIWAFAAPGLLRREKKYAVGFLGAAVPLFLAGCALGFYILPKGISVMLGFTPDNMDITNLIEMTSFLSLEIKMILVFGISFVLPVILVGLNLAGVVRGYQLGKARKFVIFGSFVFGAIATPSTDPFSMLALSVPLTILFMLSEVICRLLDKRKKITGPDEYAIDLDDGR